MKYLIELLIWVLVALPCIILADLIELSSVGDFAHWHYPAGIATVLIFNSVTGRD